MALTDTRVVLVVGVPVGSRRARRGAAERQAPS